MLRQEASGTTEQLPRKSWTDSLFRPRVAACRQYGTVCAVVSGEMATRQALRPDLRPVQLGLPPRNARTRLGAAPPMALRSNESVLLWEGGYLSAPRQPGVDGGVWATWAAKGELPSEDV